MENLTKLRNDAFFNAIEHGWHNNNKSDEHFKCLIISELMEAVEAHRKKKRAQIDLFEEYQDKIGFDINFEMHIKDTLEDELADSFIRILDMAGLKDVDLILTQGVFKSKLFTENIYEIVCTLVTNDSPSFCLNVAASLVNTLAESKNIDLERHIKMKMKYNTNRPYKHGNKLY